MCGAHSKAMKIQILILWLLLCTHTLCAKEAKLRILTSEDPPLSYINAQGQPDGLTVAFVQAVLNRLQLRTPIEVIPWARAYHALQTENNIVAFPVARTESRENKFHWISILNRNLWVFYTKKGKRLTVKNLDDLKHVGGIGVVRDDARDAFLRRHGFTNIFTAADLDTLHHMLHKNRIDLTFFSYTGLIPLSKKIGISPDEYTPAFQVNPPGAYITISKETPLSVVQQWKNASQKIKSDGTFNTIADEWVIRLKEQHGLESHVADGALNLWPKTSKQP